jgi:hypothetical protein
MPDHQLHLFQDWGPENDHDRQTGLEAIRRIKGNLRDMAAGNPRFMGTEQRKRMGAESSHMGMIEGNDRRQSTKAHLAEAHGWGDSDFGIFGPGDQYLEGAHGQEHDFNPAVNHSH